METITLTGDVDALAAMDLKVRLLEVTDAVRPSVRVDLSDVDRIHLAAVSALIAAARHAERRRGQLHVVLPTRRAARREFELADWFGVARAGESEDDTPPGGILQT